MWAAFFFMLLNKLKTWIVNSFLDLLDNFNDFFWFHPHGLIITSLIIGILLMLIWISI